jgi:predicted hydrocarbon binding protein
MVATQDLNAGRLTEDGIRYVMMRPDVLMGVAHGLSAQNAALFFKALENSAFLHSQASFSQYRAGQMSVTEDVLSGWFSIAARLGWGQWSSPQTSALSHEVVVHDSPFAAGHGPSAVPVCAAIAGVLKAMMLVARSAVVEVREVACAAQGSPSCRFNVTPAKPQDSDRSSR